MIFLLLIIFTICLFAIYDSIVDYNKRPKPGDIMIHYSILDYDALNPFVDKTDEILGILEIIEVKYDDRDDIWVKYNTNGKIEIEKYKTLLNFGWRLKRN